MNSKKEKIMEYVFLLTACVSILAVAMICIFLFANGFPAMKKIGFDANDKSRVKLVRPTDIMQIEPVIQECFDRGYFHWGDYPPLRWGVQNTKRVRSSKKQGVDTGNFIYAKIEAKSRKTDMFLALVASMTIEPELGTGEPVGLPPIGAITI